MSQPKDKKKHGWVVQSAVTDRFVNNPLNEGLYTYLLKNAHVFNTRTSARVEKISWERVRKVKTNKKGKAVKIIKGR